MDQAASEEAEERPWEQPGAVRRDWEPHHARLLNVFAVVSVVLALFSICGGLSGIIAFAIAIPVIMVARRDLASMASGSMDHRGEEQTRFSRDLAVAAMIVPVFYLAFGSLCVFGLTQWR